MFLHLNATVGFVACAKFHQGRVRNVAAASPLPSKAISADRAHVAFAWAQIDIGNQRAMIYRCGVELDDEFVVLLLNLPQSMLDSPLVRFQLRNLINLLDDHGNQATSLDAYFIERAHLGCYAILKTVLSLSRNPNNVLIGRCISGDGNIDRDKLVFKSKPTRAKSNWRRN
jgi:hypothetical protein